MERTVDFDDMTEEGRFFFNYPDGISVEDADQGVILRDASGNSCQAKFIGIQSQRDYSLCAIEVLPETWNGAFPPDKIRALKSL